MPFPGPRDTTKIAAERINSSERVGAGLVGKDNLKIGLRFPDVKMRRVTLYCAHGGKRDPQHTEAIGMIDPATNAVMAGQTIKGFGDGMYVTFDIRGTTELRIRASPQNRATLSALFIDPTPAGK